MLKVLPRVDKQECATPDLFCTICRYPRPRRNFLLTSPFFRRTRILPQSSVRPRAGHRPCDVKPGQVHEAKLSKRLAARASSKRLRQQKIPLRANPSRSCTLLFIYSWCYVSTQSQSHAPVQCIVLKCPEWAERSTQEVHKRSKIGLFRCYSECHGKNQSSDNIS